MKFIASLIATLCFFMSAISHAALLNINPESVEAEAWTILDSQTGQTIASHNEDLQRAPASLTKMMVAYITLKEIQAGKLDKNEVITATSVVNMVMWDESQMYLKEGDQISVDQLLAGLIVMSANDAAVTLAEKISGSVPKFVERMNQEAKALGMQHTNFQNPAGITMPEHYSTAADLAKLSQALVNETPNYLFYSKQQSFSYNQRFHRATNLLLKIDPTVDGLKTGFTRAAGYNLAATAIRPSMDMSLSNRRLIVVVMGSKSAVKRAEVAHKLMNLAYTYTRNEVALKDKQVLAELPVVQSTLKMFKVATKKPELITTSLYDQSYSIDLNQFDQSTQRVMLDTGNGTLQSIEPLRETQTHLNIEVNETQLTAPLAKVMQLATVNVYQNNQLIHTILIEDQVDIEEANFFEKFLQWLFGLFSNTNADVILYPIGK
ncbi:D-alanyl-D-alanine carboxypeptidase family protein [Acinetobacter schindleri]|uniref:D-alanyl-D-alanine carboxypeptidase family protein n=1 Tax=Acinetobacter schindleri TaxID=108981 RepID=UPI0013B09AF5|nr:D-alanyl-D-alanine carboxypeptidase family protein [Acinetobacter schindleri]QIC63849.1 D-alanyl-D-alanine carboxypeptidase [Acinetobacter schindleri]